MNFPSMDYFRAIHNSTGLNNAKDAKVAEFQRRFGYDFDSSINVVHDALRNDVPQDFIITPTQTGCNIWARPGETFNIGDIIYYNTIHWLVTDVNFHDDLTRSGRMVRCNRQVRWQNQRTGEIIERWCLVTKPYTSNIEEGMAIATSNREFKIQIPYDEETIQIDLDRRFLLEVINGEPKAYTVTSVDAQTNRYQDVDGGFLIWNLSQGEYNPSTDNVELMIANYFDPKITPDPEEPLLPCLINGRDTIRGGMSRTYEAVFYDESGEITSEPVTVWNVSADSDAIAWSADGNTLALTLPDDGLPVGSIITITVTDADGVYTTAEMQVEVIGLL